ncbi:MAG: thiamine pyrophosphate-dependent dehydrogenase E1 component subunit alpha [Candidatus Thermoplasmatota archaeon]|jgi:TPP-dependent pyruvate/acetoin dehydrogenase alpha subunit|nr:thiamine pyrophosphate-dependent dehydrogenase E1 component subunit alpha [Candidatus Thermoplasmatota archaeon]MCL5987587.1 thiamine pyrophosphate-dependent dehydrogenase E1 component subunit alpha [Candidatus Thermoplasmatota archaeon]
MDEKELFVKAYKAMALSRALDRKIVMSQRQGRVGFYTPTIGQEALQIGLSMTLEKEDIIYEYYRDVPFMLHRGVPPAAIIDQVMGNSSDSEKGRQMPSHYSSKEFHFMSVQSPVAANLPPATGAAYEIKYRKKKNIVVATFGDGSTSTPDFHAAMNMAAVYDLPLVFLCENNRWAISLPIEKQTRVEIWKKAEAYGMRGIKVDGNDLFAMYEAAKKEVETVRKERKPVLIEAVSYRIGPHSTSDDPNKYRTAEITDGSEKDPLIIAEKGMIERNYLTKEEIEKIKTDSKETIDRIFDEREKIPAPKPESIFTDVYEKPNWIIEEEKGEIL